MPRKQISKRKQGKAAPTLRLNHALVAGILAALVVAASWAQLQRELWQMSIRLLDSDIKALAEGAIIILPFWFLKGKWRWAVMVPVWIVSLFTLGNLLYYRQFESLIPFSSYFFTANYTPLLFGSIPSLWGDQDWIFLAIPAVYTLWFAIRSRHITGTPPFRLSAKLIASAVSITIFLWGQWIYTRDAREVWESNDLSRPLSVILEERYLAEMPPNFTAWQNGLAVSTIKNAIIEIATSRRTIKYNYDQRAEIAEFLDENRSLRKASNNVLSENRRKNLILIVVESLNAWIADCRVNNVEVTPTLNALIHSPGSIACTRVMTQVDAGGSSDALLIYNTGLLPTKGKSAAMLYDGHLYPSLAKTLGNRRRSIEIICEEATSWNHANMNRAYGYDEIHDRDSLVAAGHDYTKVGNDRAVLEYAAEKVRTLPRPFFVEITTLGMHMPFKEEATSHSIPEADLAGVVGSRRNYMLSARYFDKSLADFIESLKRHGLWDNTVLIVASDHNAAVSHDEYESAFDSAPGQIVFVAANTGTTRLIERQCGQIDVFPTILDIMGIPDTGGWRGLGLSMLNPRGGGAVDHNGNLHGHPGGGMEQYLKRAWDVSSLMIRGDWFTTQQQKQ